MRIKFLENVPVELTSVPRDAYGAVGIRFTKAVPRFSTVKRKGEKAIPTAVMSAASKSHFFRAGWSAELPEAMAMQFIAEGKAEAASTVHVDRNSVGESDD